MLTRLYIDNFRCFVDFEHRPAAKELILGGNGSGKSSLMDALLMVRQLVISGDTLDGSEVFAHATRWLNRSQITVELEAELEEAKYRYGLIIELWGEPKRVRVASEKLKFDEKPIFEFSKGEVHLYNDRFEHRVTYDFDPSRSALATIIAREDNRALSRFKLWLSQLFCFQLNPFAMIPRAEGENLHPKVDLSNIAAWYRHLVQADPKQNASLLGSLRHAIEGLGFLQLEAAGENVRLLVAEFEGAGGRTSKFYFNELSDGQRCLVCLYTILHFVVAKGGTVILDEPDNFLSIREIQPWLTALDDAIEENHGQALIISHHPEIINQWAPSNGVQLIRDGIGPVRAVRWRGDAEACLTPAEVIARGWERE